MSDRPIIACNPSDTLPTSIRYCWADLYSTYTMYNPPDVRWDVLNNRMSSYYVCYYHISGLNGADSRKIDSWIWCAGPLGDIPKEEQDALNEECAGSI
jgi:hypothetical protein